MSVFAWVIGRSAQLTSNTGQQLPRKTLDLTTGKWNEAVGFEEVKDALAEEIGDYADVVPKVEAIAKVNAFVAVFRIVHGQGL